jgi:hypothetical protein
MPNEKGTISCWICDKTLLPQDRHVDPLGYPVHRSCYAELIREEKSKRQFSRPPKDPTPVGIRRNLLSWFQILKDN